MHNAITVGSLFIAPKVFTYLHSKPAEISRSFFNRLRSDISDILEKASTQLGKNGQFICLDILGDNAWISALALAILLKNRPLFGNHPAEAASAILGVSSIFWLTRYSLAIYLSKTNPSLLPWIAPSSFPQETNTALLRETPSSSYSSLEEATPLEKTLQDRLRYLRSQT